MYMCPEKDLIESYQHHISDSAKYTFPGYMLSWYIWYRYSRNGHLDSNKAHLFSGCGSIFSTTLDNFNVWWYLIESI